MRILAAAAIEETPASQTLPAFAQEADNCRDLSSKDIRVQAPAPP